jgi:alkanesulfonate monooxygenase SsuD/methylene tetrahydromethanopterin reductase-like flavin-dependent oxidoreductase (luciferase family)
VRFGAYFFLQAPPGRAGADVLPEEVDQMVLAEHLGYDSVWLTEHHYADYGLASAPSVLLATLAAKTQRIRIGIAVYVIPFHHPLRLAEETASIDILSGGRLTVGLGRGNRPLEFFGHGVPYQESRSRLEEGVEILVQAWTREQVNFDGQHWRIQNIPVYPKPLQQPHPPIAVAVTSPETINWTARHGYAMLSSGLGTPLAQTIANRDAYIAALREHGRRQADIEHLMRRWVVTKHVYVAPTDDEALEQARGPEMWYRDSFIRSLAADGIPGLHESVYRGAEATIQRLKTQTWEELLGDALVIGSPETVARKVARLQQIGVGEMVCWMNFGGIPPDRVRRSMRLFAEAVMPPFRGAAVDAGAVGERARDMATPAPPKRA